MTSLETHRPAFVASSKCSHFVNLLMFLFVLAKLLPERHNLYGNSLDFKLKYMRKKNVLFVQYASLVSKNLNPKNNFPIENIFWKLFNNNLSLSSFRMET